MAEKPQVINLNRSYQVCDPNTFPENLIGTEREDGEETVVNVVPYEGYNFLPTDYGYRSYFGQTHSLLANALPSRCQYILPFQTSDTHNWLVALCENGIWLLDTTSGGNWTHAVTHTFNAEVFEQWTYCVIQNVLYMYKQGTGQVYYSAENLSTFALEISNFVPTFLNMAGQIGIFKAGTRLGFWDSLNSVSWSSTFDLTDFTPSLETLAGNSTYGEIIGRIVLVLESGEGFLIYSNGSIVGVSLSTDTNMMWDARKVMDVGITNPNSVCFGKDNADHYVYTTAGILQLGGYTPISGKYETKFVMPDIFDFLKENRNPVYMACVGNRYLCFQVFDGNYIYGRTSNKASIVDPATTSLILADEYWDGDITVLPSVIDGNTLKTIIDQWLAGNSPTTMTNCL